MRGFLGRVLIGALAGGLLAVAGVALFADENLDAPRPAAGPTRFVVEDGRILSPDGRRFVVKGITIPYGTFAGGDRQGLGALNYVMTKADFRRLDGLDVNTVKVLVTPRPRDSAQLPRLRKVVRRARERGFVVQIAPAFTTFREAKPLLQRLARTYRRDPYVWLQPMSQPNCPGGPPTPRCFDWVLWQRQQTELIETIRDEGMRSPVVVNTPNYSSDLSRIDTYPLQDDSVIWGVHRFANLRTEWTEAERQDERRAWANRTLDQAVIVDAVGSRAAPRFPALTPWVEGFLDFTTEWIAENDGSGVTAFVWHWYGANSMTKGSGALTDWGQLFVNRYLQRISGRG